MEVGYAVANTLVGAGEISIETQFAMNCSVLTMLVSLLWHNACFISGDMMPDQVLWLKSVQRGVLVEMWR